MSTHAMYECAVCYEDEIQQERVEHVNDSLVCHTCISKQFRAALRNENDYPARLGTVKLSFSDCHHVLVPEFWVAYAKKEIEYDCPPLMQKCNAFVDALHECHGPSRATEQAVGNDSLEQSRASRADSGIPPDQHFDDNPAVIESRAFLIRRISALSLILERIDWLVLDLDDNLDQWESQRRREEYAATISDLRHMVETMGLGDEEGRDLFSAFFQTADELPIVEAE
nr:hypothetical protein B0A51_08656 [Rachicladosporium sp. CCFEE 5018]